MLHTGQLGGIWCGVTSKWTVKGHATAPPPSELRPPSREWLGHPNQGRETREDARACTRVHLHNLIVVPITHGSVNNSTHFERSVVYLWGKLTSFIHRHFFNLYTALASMVELTLF